MEIHTTEMHTAGEPLRIVERGFPDLKAPTLLGKKREVSKHYDDIRRMVMCEPRGHADMFGALLCDSELDEADLGVLFFNHSGLSPMCGHGVIALARYAVDKKLVTKSDTEEAAIVKIHCPCGLVVSKVFNDGSVSLTSVSSYVVATDVDVKLENENCHVKVDVSFGGAFYAILDCSQLGLDLTTCSISYLRDLGVRVKKIMTASVELPDPEEDLRYFHGVMLTDGVKGQQPSRVICVFGDGQVDRSPCGSGVTSLVALEYHQQTIGLNEEKILSNSKLHPLSQMRAQVVAECEIMLPNRVHPTKSVQVQITGKAYFTGRCVFTVEEDDILARRGFHMK